MHLLTMRGSVGHGSVEPSMFGVDMVDLSHLIFLSAGENSRFSISKDKATSAEESFSYSRSIQTE